MTSPMIDTDDGFVARLVAQAGAAPERLFARYDGAPVTFGDVDRGSDALAAALMGAGVGKGDRVAVMTRNSTLVVALMFAIGKCGAVWVPINVQARGDNLAYILEHSRPSALVANVDVLDQVEACGAALDGVKTWTVGEAGGGRSLEVLMSDAAPRFAAALPQADDPYAIMYTSGTTGRPKGVIVTHRMLRLSGEAIARVSGAGEGDAFHMWEPLYHIGGAQMIVLPLIRPVHLAMVDRFSASRFWDEVRGFGATHIHFLGGILQILLKQPPGPRDREHGARVAFGGGCPPDVWRPFEARFGVQIRESYGMTEAASVTTYNDRGPVGSVGRPLPWFRVDILDEQGRPVPAGGRGEIVVTALLEGAITPGYYENPEATARALEGGSLHTGDIGSFDAHGNLFFHGRASDNVRVGGENVSAFEVEHVAAKHPDVEDCAMVGVASDVGEQDIKLFVKPASGAALDVEALSKWLGERLAPYQAPRYIALVEEFDRTPSQRIMKHTLSTATDDCWERRRR